MATPRAEGGGGEVNLPHIRVLTRPTEGRRIFRFFRKGRKCKISEEYNAKRGSEPSKIMDFGIDFSFNFHVFPNPSKRAFFEGQSARL